MIFTEYHPDEFFVLPSLMLAHGTCENPACQESHREVRLGWLMWSVGFCL